MGFEQGIMKLAIATCAGLEQDRCESNEQSEIFLELRLLFAAQRQTIGTHKEVS